MPTLSKEQRNAIEKKTLDVVLLMHGGVAEGNYKRIQAQFKVMSDEDFYKWAMWCGEQNENTIHLYEEPFKDIKLTDIQKAADYLKLPLEEYIYYHDADKDGLRSATKVSVGYLHCRRMEQMLSKKNHYTFSNDQISPFTGDVSGKESKVSGFSEAEATAVMSWNAPNLLKEIYGPRSTSQGMKNEMYRIIARDGSVSMSELEEKDSIEDHTVLNTLNTYMLASGIRSDLIGTTMKTPYTIRKDAEDITHRQTKDRSKLK